MYIKIKFNHYLLILVLVVPCNVAILFGDFTKPEVSQTSGINIFFNLFGMTRFKDHSFTSVLDASGLSKGLFQLLKGALRRYTTLFKSTIIIVRNGENIQKTKYFEIGPIEEYLISKLVGK